MHTYGFVILAAGSSTRLGQPKQLVQVGNKSLLQHTCEQAVSLQKGPVLVILGAFAPIINASLGNSVSVEINPTWEEGIGSSIRFGTEMMMNRYPTIEGMILMVCDQPFLTSTHLQHLIDEADQHGKAIIASNYQHTSGTPVLFKKKYFDQLIQLRGDEGAKKLIREFSVDAGFVNFPSGEVDIDTREDLEKLPPQFEV